MTKIKKIGLLCILTLLLGGCWSKHELNELAIAIALGIDKVGDDYEITVQIVDPSEISVRQVSAQRSPVVTYHTKGKSIFEALRKMTTLAARKPYFSHLQVVVLGEDLAKEGIQEPLDFIARDHEFRNDFNVIMSYEATAKEVLNVLTPIEKVPANKIVNSLRTSEHAWGSIMTITIDELVNTLNNKEKGTVLAAIEIQGDKKLGMDQTNVQRIQTPVLLRYAGLAVLEEGRFVGLLSEEESRSIGFLKDSIHSTAEIIACPEQGSLSTEIIQSDTKVKGSFERGQPKIAVQIHIIQNVAEVKCTINLTEDTTIQTINQITAQDIQQQIEQALATIQQYYQVDIVGFSNVLHRADAKQWKKIKSDWATIFPTLQVDVKVDVQTQGSGTIQNSITNK
ncbi:Ger(x)C family spore germination protein [Lysinibacillus sp. FSL K6-0232]|uniref:Ger(x)C family spore germination protein n=1 Tax=Lysinibacillus sp. FSL K6-0232 TaxID=2921425 RepID=UPI0030F902D4